MSHHRALAISDSLSPSSAPSTAAAASVGPDAISAATSSSLATVRLGSEILHLIPAAATAVQPCALSSRPRTIIRWRLVISAGASSVRMARTSSGVTSAQLRTPLLSSRGTAVASARRYALTVEGISPASSLEASQRAASSLI